MSLPALSLHRASCGCIGFRTSDFYMLVLKPCDGDQDTTFFLRQMLGETFEPVPPDTSSELVSTIQRLIADGYRLRTIKALLKD